MSAISIDPSQLAAAGSDLRSIAVALAGGGGQLSLGSVSGPGAVAAELPEFTTRWTRWIAELESAIDDLGSGLGAAAAYYEQRERDIAGWTAS